MVLGRVIQLLSSTQGKWEAPPPPDTIACVSSAASAPDPYPPSQSERGIQSGQRMQHGSSGAGDGAKADLI